ncbi:MAG: cyclase family protein [Thermoplasmatales archaeon]
MRIYDLSVTLETYMPGWPTNPLVNIVPTGTVARDGYNVETYYSSTHSGTHIDAPYHMLEDGTTVDNISLTQLVGDGYCIRVQPKDEEIKLNDIEEKWKKDYDGKIILLNTGWSKKRGYTKEFQFKFPGLSIDTMDFFIQHKPKVIGIDTLGIEPYSHSDFRVHKGLLSNGIVFIEDLTNLDQLIEGKKYLIVALPIKIHNASGAMARVIAIDME